MNISGTGITLASFAIQRSFVPKTKLALKWHNTQDGNYRGTSRGASQDIYESEVLLYAKQSVIDTFIENIEANRVAGSNQVTLSNFNDSEWIFGADIDYTTSIAATLWSDPKQQTRLRSFSLKVRIRAISPTFTGTAAMPDLKILGIGWEGDAPYTINKIDSYDGTFFYQDNSFDAGIFEGTFTFTDAEAIQFRRLAATIRGGDVTIAGINGVDEPFGARRGGSYPYTAKILSYEDKPYAQDMWRFQIKFAEVV